jgi:hypothetical protein
MNNNCGGGVFYLTEYSLKVKNSYSQGEEEGEHEMVQDKYNFDSFYRLCIQNFNNLGLCIGNYNGGGLCIGNFNNFRLSVSNDDCFNSRFFNDLVRMDNNFGKYFATGAEYGCEMYQDEHNCYTPGHHCTHRNQQTHVPFSVTRRSTPHE